MITALDPADYWQLRAVTADVDAAQARLELLRARRQACWLRLAAQYALDATKPYAARDEDCMLLEAAN